MNKKRLIPIITFFLLLVGMSYFPRIPILLFKIPIDKFNTTMIILYNLFCNIGYMLVLFLLYKNRIKKDFKEYFKNFSSNFELSFKYYFIGALIMIISNLIIALFINGAIANNEEAVRKLIDTAPLYMIFSVSLYAPFVEELIFRHTIYNCIVINKNNKLTKYLYILISSLIFASMHILGQVTSNLDYLYIIPYMSLSIAFSSLYYKSNNLASSIMMHSLHNTLTIILYFVSNGGF